MSNLEQLKGRWSALIQRARAVIREQRFSVLSIASLLSVLSGVTITLVVMQSTLALTALIHLLPALVIGLDSFRNLMAGRPGDWPRWLLIFSLLIAVVGVVLASGEAGFLPGKMAGSQTEKFLGVMIAFMVPLLFGVTLPRIFKFIAWGLGRIPRLGTKLARRLSAPNLYAFTVAVSFVLMLLHFVQVFERLSVPLSLDKLGVLGLLLLITALPFCIAIGLRRTLWDPALRSPLKRWMPHIPAWEVVFTFLVAEKQLDKRLGIEGDIVDLSGGLIIVAAVLSVVLYFGLIRLRRAPVRALLDGEQVRAESIQSQVDHYVDVHGISDRMQALVRRSDGGVYGVTGVRGAGKSALTRHLLDRLKGDYFTLEVTAPVRNDENMGFFCSVCRAVCRKTLDDLEPILRGRRGGATGNLWLQIRNPLLVLLAALALISLWLQIGGLTTTGPSPGTRSNLHDKVQDPLLGQSMFYRTFPIQSERNVIDYLLSQIALAVDRVGKDSEDEDSVGYLLVPATKLGHFWLLRHPLDTDVRQALASYRNNLGSGYPLSHPLFLFFSQDYNSQRNWMAIREREFADPISGNYSVGDILDVGDIHDWTRCITYARNHKNLVAPLAQLSKELRFHLCSPPSHEQKPQAGPALVSELILASFANFDPRLAFDGPRLRKFQETLQVYRYLLDGDVISRPPAADSGEAPVLDLLLSVYPADVFDPEVAVFWSAVAGILLLLFAGPVWRAGSRVTRVLVNRRYLEIYNEADGFMQQLAYQSSSETSAGLGWQGLSLGRKQTLAARELTLPGLTARYARFMLKVRSAYNDKVVIAIDELDKVHDPDQVKALLTEIKGALFAPGTFYIISISEDAARSFRRRLASGRDIFESTFDDMIDIGQMNVDAAVSMLDRLEETVSEDERQPVACLEVAALFGGGIPREIIRARRTLAFEITNQADPTGPWAARTLLADELAQWEGNLGDANLSGADTIKVRWHARQAAKHLRAGEDKEATYAAVWDALEPCIKIIDPNELRKSAGYRSDVLEADASSGHKLEMHAEYRRIAGDLQALLRLMILTHLCERILRPVETRENYEVLILECHRALADKPALAETLLYEMRS